MKLKFAVALAVGLFATLARADSSVTITVDLGTPQLFDTPTELVIPFSGLNGTLVSGQTEMVTVLFDSGEFIEYRPPTSRSMRVLYWGLAWQRIRSSPAALEPSWQPTVLTCSLRLCWVAQMSMTRRIQMGLVKWPWASNFHRRLPRLAFTDFSSI
jgi:hypothetical protein